MIHTLLSYQLVAEAVEGAWQEDGAGAVVVLALVADVDDAIQTIEFPFLFLQPKMCKWWFETSTVITIPPSSSMTWISFPTCDKRNLLLFDISFFLRWYHLFITWWMLTKLLVSLA